LNTFQRLFYFQSLAYYIVHLTFHTLFDKNKEKLHFYPEFSDTIEKDSNSRNSQELLIVGDYLFKNYDYFKNLKNNSTQIKMEKIAKICKLEKFKPNETIIVYGDIGNKFYIVLEGQVGVFLPEYYEKELTPFEYFKLLEKIKRVDKFKYERLKSKNNQISFDNINMNVLYNSKFMKNKIKLFLEKNDKFS